MSTWWNKSLVTSMKRSAYWRTIQQSRERPTCRARPSEVLRGADWRANVCGGCGNSRSYRCLWWNARTAIAATALAGGAGGLIGSILAKWVGDHHAGYLQEQINHGGLLLWVRTWAAEDEKRAVEILKKHSANGAHVHTLPMTDYSARMGSAACGYLDRDMVRMARLPQRRMLEKRDDFSHSQIRQRN